jgi:hypothetical protein
VRQQFIAGSLNIKRAVWKICKKSAGFWPPKKFSVEIAPSLQQEWRDPEGFRSYQEVHLWLWLIKGIASSYQAVYSLVRGELKSKLKIPRPRSISQKLRQLMNLKITYINR